MSKNDFSLDQLELLNIVEHNLNMNLNNVNLQQKLVSTADSVKKSLKERFGDLWSAPALA